MNIKITIVIILIAISVIGGIAYDYYSAPNIVTINEPIQQKSYEKFPEIEFTNFSGENFTVENIQAPTILISFWATWCSTCVAEMPGMLNLAQKTNGKISIIFISIDENQQIAEKFQQKLVRQNLPVSSPNIHWVWDKNKDISLNKFNVLKTPETIVLNKNREMINKIVGKYDWEKFPH